MTVEGLVASIVHRPSAIKLQPAHLVPILVFGVLLLIAQTRSAVSDGGQEEIDATRQNILQGVRDEIHRRTKHPKGKAEPGAKTDDSGAARQVTRARSARTHPKKIKAGKTASP
jgi:hypothetical protein